MDDGSLMKALTSALAPVFLISGVGALLGSMTVRFGRVIDRSREVMKDAKLNPLAQDPADVDAELEFHLAMRIDELVRSGLSPEEARAEALLPASPVRAWDLLRLSRAGAPGAWVVREHWFVGDGGDGAPLPRLASLPETIRGYGHVREAQARKAARKASRASKSVRPKKKRAGG